MEKRGNRELDAGEGSQIGNNGDRGLHEGGVDDFAHRIDDRNTSHFAIAVAFARCHTFHINAINIQLSYLSDVHGLTTQSLLISQREERWFKI